MTAMGLRPRELLVKADDSYGLKAKEIARWGWWQLCYGLEVEEITCLGQGQQWAVLWWNWQLESAMGMSPKSAISTLDVDNMAMSPKLVRLMLDMDNVDDPEVGKIDNGYQKRQWGQSQQIQQWRLKWRWAWKHSSTRFLRAKNSWVCNSLRALLKSGNITWSTT